MDNVHLSRIKRGKVERSNDAHIRAETKALPANMDKGTVDARLFILAGMPQINREEN